MTTNDKWINRIQQKMEHYEADVPEGLYDDIVAEMQRRGLKPLAATSRLSLIHISEPTRP